MESIFWFIFESGSDILDSVLFLFFINRKLECGREDRRKDFGYIAAVFALDNLFAYLDAPFYFSLFVYLGVSLTYTYFFKKGDLFWRVTGPIIAHAVFFGINYLLFTFVSLSPVLQAEATLQASPQRVMLVSLYIFSELVVFWLIATPASGEKVITRAMQSGIVLCSLFVVLVVGFVFDQSLLIAGDSIAVNTLGLVSFCFVLLAMVALLQFDRQAHQAAQVLELQAKTIRAADERALDKSRRLGEEQLRSLQHETRQVMISIKGYLDAEDPQGLREYAASFLEDAASAQHQVVTGNTALDTLISQTAYIAEKQQTTFSHSIIVPESVPIDDYDLGAIVGNLLSNALEATLLLPEEERFIHLTIRPLQQMLQIEAVNASAGNYRRSGKELLTTKENTLAHGLGLKRIKDLVEKYDGNCSFEAEGVYFCATVFLPLSPAVLPEVTSAARV